MTTKTKKVIIQIRGEEVHYHVRTLTVELPEEMSHVDLRRFCRAKEFTEYGEAEWEHVHHEGISATEFTVLGAIDADAPADAMVSRTGENSVVVSDPKELVQR